MASRFVEALRRRGGTLALSWLNLCEYADLSHVQSRRAAESFVDSMLSAVFCIDVDLAAVDDREKRGDSLPYGDRAVAARVRRT